MSFKEKKYANNSNLWKDIQKEKENIFNIKSEIIKRVCLCNANSKNCQLKIQIDCFRDKNKPGNYSWKGPPPISG